MVTQGDVVAQISGLYELIGERLGSLPEQLNTTKGDDIDSDSDHSTIEESYASSNSEARKETVVDMLSVFDRTALPAEYGREFTDDAPATASGEEPFIPRSLAATIYGLAVRDETFFRRLRKVLTGDVCASVYFAKQRARAKDAFSKLDRYVQLGPSTSESRNMDVQECARILRLIVHQICEERESRASKEPLGAAVKSNVAEILVEILHEVVCSRNRDVCQTIAWERNIVDYARDRNLYLYLIGDPPRFENTQPLGMRDDFVIDRLNDFPANEWRHLLERLTTILDHIHENAAGGDRASAAYEAKLEAMLREYTNQAFEPSSSSVQRRRPTISSPREHQRRRFE